MRKSKRKGSFVSKFQLIKTFIKTRKFPKLLRDGLLIFVSVFFATWATNYREHYIESKKYGSTLLLFRDEIHENIRKFRHTYDSTLLYYTNTNSTFYGKSPHLIYQDNNINEILKLIKDGSHISETEAINKLIHFGPWVDWRHSTGISEVLLNLYSNFIIQDSLFLDILQYQRIMGYEFDNYIDWGVETSKIRALLNTYIDFDEWQNGSFQFVSLKELLIDDYILFKNLVVNLCNINSSLIRSDKQHAAFFNEFTLKIDKVLDKRRVAVDARDYEWIVVDGSLNEFYPFPNFKIKQDIQ